MVGTEEKPVQKWTTAGAERSPPAPWVNMKGVWATADWVLDGVVGAYSRQVIGVLTRSFSTVRAVVFDVGDLLVLDSGGCFFVSLECLDFALVCDLALELDLIAFSALLVDGARAFSILPESWAFGVLVLA